MELNSEKKNIEDRLRFVESQLLNSESKNDLLNNEKLILKRDLENIMDELSRIKVSNSSESD